MAKPKSHHPMPVSQAQALVDSFTAYRAALDPGSAENTTCLSALIRALDEAGWSRRATATALGMSRERLQRIAAVPAAEVTGIPPYTTGRSFPAQAMDSFRTCQERAGARRKAAEQALSGVLHGARAAGWPYGVLAGLVGASGERLRQITESVPPGKDIPAFAPFTRILKDKPLPAARAHLSATDRDRLRGLAARARTAKKLATPEDGRGPERSRALEGSLTARRASEELSALLIAFKRQNVPWHELDDACGYRPGGARARAIRHGYATAPPSMTPYRPTPQDLHPAE